MYLNEVTNHIKEYKKVSFSIYSIMSTLITQIIFNYKCLIII